METEGEEDEDEDEDEDGDSEKAGKPSAKAAKGRKVKDDDSMAELSARMLAKAQKATSKMQAKVFKKIGALAQSSQEKIQAMKSK